MNESTSPAGENSAIDPVCGMTVDARWAEHTSRHQGTDYYFCGGHCLERFEEDPARFLDRRDSKPDASQDAEGHVRAPGGERKSVEYTCPMHPEVVSKGPGSCPKCGMALEPVDASEDEEDGELRTMQRRFWVSLALTAPVFLIAMSEMLPGNPVVALLGSGGAGWIQFVLAAPVVAWGGFPFFQRGWSSIVNRSWNMFTLIALGTGVSFLYSAAALLVPDLFPESFRGDGGQVSLYFEAAAVITTLVLLGQVIEIRGRRRTGEAIRSLMQLAPKTARRIGQNGEDEDVPLSDIEPGDRLRIRPGERVAVDGEVVEGRGSVDESMITGEPNPIEKGPGEAVTGGTFNQRGSFVMKAQRVGSETVLAQIIDLVAKAQRSRAPIQRVADQAASYFVPAVVGSSLVAFVVWAFWGPPPALAHAIVNAVAVLIIACPCALGLATPMSIMVGTGRGASMGVLIRDAEALENLHRVDTLVLDKTGTLTEGRPRLRDVVAAEGFERAAVLRGAAALEKGSEHPLAEAILAGAQDQELTLPAVEDFDSVSGRGIRGRFQGRVLILGSAGFLQENGIDVEPLRRQAEERRQRGQTVVFLADEDRLAGLLAVADPIRDRAAETLRTLQNEGLRIVMLTGDNRTSAQAVARELGIREVRAEVLPDQKNEAIRDLQSEGRNVAMAGDGINDAPALAQANIGIAMGTGTDVAMRSSAITLVKGDLAGIVRAIRLSRGTIRNIKQNLFFAFVYNALGVPLAAGVLYPWLGILLSPMIAAAAMSFSSVSVIGNALRLRRLKL